MELIPTAIDYLLQAPHLTNWPAAIQVIKTIAGAKPSHWMIPAAACQAAAGTLQAAMPAVAAIAALHTAIIMVDDILDNDGRFEPMGFGKGDVANLSLALCAAGQNAIQRSGVDEHTQCEVFSILNRTLLQTAVGQNADAHTTVTNEADYWRITRQKSSPFFGACFSTGALMGGASPELAQVMSEIGFIYGEMVQIHDDLKDILASPASQDWNEGHYSLPVLFALTVDHPNRQTFMEMRKNVSEESVLLAAQKILIRCGAVSYCAQQLFKRYHSAEDLLNKSNAPDRAPIAELFQKIIDPVNHLFDKIGAPRPQ